MRREKFKVEKEMSTLWEGSMRRSLQEARRKMLKLLYFIDSPGGSALTSDLIWRELELTKKVKPIVVSMVIMLSGGYYMRVTPILFCSKQHRFYRCFLNIT
jgi:protease-4